MVSWILLKVIPALAYYLQLQNRTSIYAVLGIAILASGLAKLKIRSARTFETFGIPLTAALFFASILPNLAETLDVRKAAEIFPTARGLFLVLTLLWIVRSPRQGRIWLLMLFGALVGLQIANLISGSIVVMSGAFANKYDIDQQRLTGIGNSPWALSYAAIALVGATMLTAEAIATKWIRLLILALLSVGFASLFLAVSRAAIVGLVLILMFWAGEKAFRGKSGTFKINMKSALSGTIVLILVLGLCLLVGSLLFPIEMDYYLGLWNRRFNPGIQGEGARWSSNAAGIAMFFDKPFFGVGWECGYFLSQSYGASMATTAHNGFVQAGSQGGILGLAFSVMLMVVVPWRMFWVHRHVPGSLIFLGSWGAVFAYNMLASNFMLDSHWDILSVWILTLAARGQLAQVRNKVPVKAVVPPEVLALNKPGFEVAVDGNTLGGAQNSHRI